jgi:hypothetical protein
LPLPDTGDTVSVIRAQSTHLDKCEVLNTPPTPCE